MMSSTSRAAGLLALALGLLAGCGDDNDAGPFADVAGAYYSSTFTVTRTGEAPEDVLAAGGWMDLALAADGTTTGWLEIPAAITRDEPIDANMVGTATRTEDMVEFHQQADTFVRDAVWVIGGASLTGSFSDAQGTIEVTLTLMPD